MSRSSKSGDPAVPGEVAALLAEGLDKKGGTEAWLARQDQARRDSFDASCRLYLRRKAEGTTGASLSAFCAALQSSLGYPFGWGALRTYLTRKYPDLFAATAVRR